jgi:hypothetical protein
MQAQMRQERQEMRLERQEMREEMRQERMVRQQQAPMPPPPPPVSPRDKHREFMRYKPPTFASSPDPLHVDDWLKSVEKMLNIAQCSDREKVFYASGHLTGPVALGTFIDFRYSLYKYYTFSPIKKPFPLYKEKRC